MTTEQRESKSAAEILALMNQEEKIALISGTDFMYTKGVPRLGVRRIRMADASMGLRDERVAATAFPATIALAATWDRAMAVSYGSAVGAEFRAAGVDVLLGPGVNIYRVPQGGRNFEYLGEDPFLAAALAVGYIQGVQAQGVSATVKHLAANSSDWHRCSSNSVVDARALREVYLPAFQAAIREAGVLSLMTSYNLLNGEYTSESRTLLHDLVLEEWGFQGLIMSDWEGTWSAAKAFDSGLHLEMPGGKTWKPEVVEALLAEDESRHEELDRKVLRVLEWTLAIESLQKGSGPGKRKGREHRVVALEVARRGTVLLQNRNDLLPLGEAGMRVNVLGPWASQTPTSGGGAALVEAVEPRSVLGSLLEVAPDWHIVRGEGEMEKADAVIVCVGFGPEIEREGCDRPFELPWEQEELVRRCVERHARTIVVVFAGGAVAMSGWIERAAAVLFAWYPGEAGALALAEIVVGQVNPSGRLPISIERSWKDAPAFGNYLPADGALYEKPDFVGRGRETFDVRYEEGVFCGYRHYEERGVSPLFAFGHGLSYTRFEYSDLQVEDAERGVTVSFTIRNAGSRDGDEVAQVYVQAVVSEGMPAQIQLQGFQRVFVEAGGAVAVSVQIRREAFDYFCTDSSCRKTRLGKHLVKVGSSARSLALQGEIVR